MPAPAWEDLEDFLSVEDFATIAQFITVSGEREVTGIFDEPHFNAETGEYDMAAGEPRFTCRELDVVGVKRNDACTINGMRYSVDHDLYPDGTGMAVVQLSRSFGE